jgi:hypothetical protein
MNRLQIGSDKRLVKIVATAEVVDGISLGFSENAFADEIVDHLPEIFAAADAPVAEDRQHHRAIHLQRILPDSLEELLAADVAAAFLGFFALLDGVLESVAKEIVGFAIVA